MTNDSRIIWAYTESHLKERMTRSHHYYQDDSRIRVPDPESLSPEQVDELYCRIKAVIDIHMDFPDQGFWETAWQALAEMGLVQE